MITAIEIVLKQQRQRTHTCRHLVDKFNSLAADSMCLAMMRLTIIKRTQCDDSTQLALPMRPLPAAPPHTHTHSQTHVP